MRISYFSSDVCSSDLLSTTHGKVIEMILQIKNLTNEIEGKPILKGLSLSINAGEIHAIMGPNGAGKSTLAYTLGGRPGYEATGGTAIDRKSTRLNSSH